MSGRIGKSQLRGLVVEAAIALTCGLIAAFLVPPEMMRRIDEMIVTFMSIVVAAAIPGVALTAAAQRPLVATPLDARRLGDRLLDQVAFWFGFLWVGGVGIGTVVIGRALDWSLSIVPDRPLSFPSWIPPSGAWLILAAIAATALTVIRTRHLVRAVQNLIQLGTDAHADLIAERQRALHDEVAKQIRQSQDEPRGAPVDERPRH